MSRQGDVVACELTSKGARDASRVRSPRVLIPPRRGDQLAPYSAVTRQRNRNIRARDRLGKRKWHTESGFSKRSKVETTFHRYPGHPGPIDASKRPGVPESRGEGRMQDPERDDGARRTDKKEVMHSDSTRKVIRTLLRSPSPR